MASWMVHLRMAEALLPRMGTIDETAFIMGNMAPDSGVPNEDWTEFHPPASVSHFRTKTDNGSFIDADRFRDRYLNDVALSGYSLKALSFFLGYYAHLLTDIRWAGTIYAPLKTDWPEEYAENKSALVRNAKEDWYDLDYLYLEQHPAFRAFSVYENAVGFENEFMEEFSRDAFDNRRAYICGFYRNGEHGDLHRAFRYLKPEQVDAFIRDTSTWILTHISGYLRR